MNDETRKQLQEVLGTYDDKIAKVERLEVATRAAQAAFPARFAALQAEIIRPAIQEFADALNLRGHEATAREQGESSSAAGGVTSAAISLHVIPKPFVRKSTEAQNIFIEVTFSANRKERKITVSSTNTVVHSSGGFGKRGEYEIEAVTADVVESHLLRALQDALVGTR